MKVIPKLAGLETSIEEMYKTSKTNKLSRLGVKVNTPIMCNWACPYCYAGSDEFKERPKLECNENDPFHDKDWDKKMIGWIKEAIEQGVKDITINGTFEPLTSPKLMQIIKFCSESDVRVTLVTNGTLLTDKIIDELYENNVSILTKMNVPMVDELNENYIKFCEIQKHLSGRKGTCKEIYEYQKGIIRKLIERGFNTGSNEKETRLGIETVISSKNIEYIPELVKQCREMNVYSHVEIIKLQGYGKQYEEFQVTKKQLQQLFEKVRDNDINMGFEEWQPKPPYIGGTCYQNLVRLDLLANGEVAPCPGIDIILGDLNKNSLQGILNNEDLKIIRNLDKYIEGDCKECELFESKVCYGGCRGTVFQTLKNLGLSKYECLVGSDPSCWRVRKVLNNGLSSAIFK